MTLWQAVCGILERFAASYDEWALFRESWGQDASAHRAAAQRIRDRIAAGAP